MADETTVVEKTQYKVEDTVIVNPLESSPSSGLDEENGSSTSSNNVFSDPKVLAYYKDVYEKSKYECRHVLDPNLEWTAEEERKLVRKLDWHVCLWAVWLTATC